jgi:hypothetical protein
MHYDVPTDARLVLMWHVLIDCWCVILICIENYIKWFLVGHLYIIREDNTLILYDSMSKFFLLHCMAIYLDHTESVLRKGTKFD